MASSSSSSDPQTHNPPLPNTSSSSSTRPLILTSPPPTSSPSPPVYIPQSLPVMASKFPNPSKIQDPSSGVPPPPQGILYPVASSGRGFIPKNLRPQPPQSTDQLVTVANPGGGFSSRPILTFPNQVRAFGFSTVDPQQVHVMRPPALQPSQLGSRSIATAVSGPVKSVPPAAIPPKAAAFPSSSPDFNGFKELRDRNRDETVVTINDRKVRLSDGASLYALCRSWVRNGLPQENQPQIGEGIKLLPRPLPTASGDTNIPKRNESGDEDEEKEEDVGSLEHLSASELLQRHVKRAKKVRARLRVERLQRIGRYKQRLALLLPSPVEQFRNDTAPGG
ncbi:Protein LIN37 [Macleaya cordata]|uniref:Protein LIN37 n=1 Tax=Macleaya cordata TaxID=56857 RepID=A0A200QRH2_MACCD|nr:Protein LIN37 [Macleaya cordata]